MLLEDEEAGREADIAITEDEGENENEEAWPTLVELINTDDA